MYHRCAYAYFTSGITGGVICYVSHMVSTAYCTIPKCTKLYNINMCIWRIVMLWLMLFISDASERITRWNTVFHVGDLQCWLRQGWLNKVYAYALEVKSTCIVIPQIYRLDLASPVWASIFWIPCNFWARVRGVPKKGVPAIPTIDQQLDTRDGYCESPCASFSTNSGLQRLSQVPNCWSIAAIAGTPIVGTPRILAQSNTKNRRLDLWEIPRGPGSSNP